MHSLDTVAPIPPLPQSQKASQPQRETHTVASGQVHGAVREEEERARDHDAHQKGCSSWDATSKETTPETHSASSTYLARFPLEEARAPLTPRASSTLAQWHSASSLLLPLTILCLCLSASSGPRLLRPCFGAAVPHLHSCRQSRRLRRPQVRLRPTGPDATVAMCDRRDNGQLALMQHQNIFWRTERETTANWP